MKSCKYSIIVVFLSCLFGSSTLISATFCEQKFKVYGKTAGEHSILFWELFVGGECQNWTVNGLFLGNDKDYTMSIQDHNGSIWLPPFLETVPLEQGVKLADSSGKYFLRDSVFTTPPPDDISFLRHYSALVNEGRGDAAQWYRECPVDCSDYPVFYGVNARLIYAYRDGIYKNYKFKEVLYYPDSGYIVFITDQPRVAMGHDTMHGFLVFKLEFNRGTKE